MQAYFIVFVILGLLFHFSTESRLCRCDDGIQIYSAQACDNSASICQGTAINTEALAERSNINQQNRTNTQFCSTSKLTSITFQPTCQFEGRYVRCSEPARPRTVARISCKQGYESQRAERTVVCGPDGRWFPEPTACNQICGEVVPEAVTFIDSFTRTSTQAPWHVSIYKRINSEFEHICGGTILNARIVISAMHCFWNEVQGAAFNESLYRIKAGKMYREFDDIRETVKVQSLSINKITNLDAFSGANTSYLGDIAILLLDTFIEFKTYISPVCIEYDLKLKYDDIAVPANRVGVVAGWGVDNRKEEPSVSPIKRIELSVVSRQECQKVSPFMTPDKFCASYSGIGDALCPSDGGGGLVFPQRVNSVTKYFLIGISSADASNQNGKCGTGGSYTTFTNTALYSEFISKHESSYRPTASTISCPTLTSFRNGHITYYGSDGLILSPKKDYDYYDSGSTAAIDCLTGYEISGASRQNLTCDESGIWKPLLEDITCIPVCGREASAGLAFIIDGNETDINKVPWHVGIYKVEGSIKKYVCGGSILTETIVISAMHCFWDRTIERASDPSLFKVAAGKQFVDYNSTEEPYLVQHFDVTDLKYYEYRDIHGNFASDIVLVLLNNRIEFRQHIAPICLQLDQVTILDVPVQDGLVGTLAGWGLTESHGQPSQRLKIVDLPTVNKDKCINDSGYGFQDFVTLDKFCAGHLNLDIGACQGDSGGGLAFPRTINGRKRFFLRGIVSVGANKMGTCDSSKYTAFTNVIYHDKFVRSVLFPE